MRLLRLSLHEVSADDRAIYLDQLREHWRLDAWTVAGQLLALAALAPVIARSGLSGWHIGSSLLLLLGSWAWALRAPWRLRHVTLTEQSYPRWRALTLWRELAQSLGWAILALGLWSALGERWHLLILVGLLVFIYTSMFFTTHDSGVAAVASLPILLILSAWLLVSGGEGHALIALILTASTLTCLVVGRLIEQRLMDAERLRRRNEALLAELAREIEHVRQARDEAQEANRQKSHFLATASHDLRQPLHSLTLLAGLLSRTDDPREQQRTAERMQSALDGLRFVFDQLFDIARLDAGKHPHRPQVLAVTPLLSTLHAEMGPTFDAQGLRWTCDPGPGLGCLADPVFVQRTLRNLLDNALRYTPHGGVHLRARQRGPHTVLQVWDTGCGMSRALRERIFDDYTQGHNPERQRRQGLGLGLAVVRRLADAGAYRVTVRSRPGRGSCFSVWLPSAPLPSAQLPSTVGEFAIGRPADEAAPRVPQASLPCPALIALIDDDDDVRQATRDTLQHGGWQVADGASSQQAIDAVARLGRMPVAVLSDHRLSAHADGTHEDGLQAIQALRHEFGLTLPAFLLTGDLDPSLPRQCQAQGIVHLRKPLSTTDLLQAVSQNLPDRTSDTTPSG